jgi:hypothetical protein
MNWNQNKVYFLSSIFMKHMSPSPSGEIRYLVRVATASARAAPQAVHDWGNVADAACSAKK